MTRALLDKAEGLLWQVCSDLSRAPNSEGLRNNCLSLHSEIRAELKSPRYPMAEIFDESPQAQPAPERKPMTEDEIHQMAQIGVTRPSFKNLVRSVEAFHGITGDKP